VGREATETYQRSHAALRFGVRTAGKYANDGTSPFEHEWNVFVVLDACRFDLSEQFAPEGRLYEAFGSTDSRYWCRSSTAEWIVKTFARVTPEQLAEAAYVHANGKVNSTDRSENPEAKSTSPGSTRSRT